MLKYYNQNPIIRFSAGFKLERTNGVINVFEGITNSVGVIVVRIDAPSVSRMRMRGVSDSVGDQIVHVGVGRLKVHF